MGTVYTLAGHKWSPQARRELSYVVRTRNVTDTQMHQIVTQAEAAAAVSFSLVTQSIIYSVVAQVLGKERGSL